MKEIDMFKGSDLYGKFLQSFYYCEKLQNIDLKNSKMTEAIFYHLYKAKHYEWEMRTKFNLKIKSASSDYFRNLLAFYLNAILPAKLGVCLEHDGEHPKKKTEDGKKKKIRPDILIKNEDRYVFAIEIKTNFGYDRKMKNFEDRLNDIKQTFNIHEEKIIYILQSATNVSKNFEEKYWDHENSEPQKRHPNNLPYSKIYPLFYHSPDPYYWEESKDIDRDKQINIFEESGVLKKAEKNIICRFEDIIKMVY